jgi:hypothetical protein
MSKWMAGGSDARTSKKPLRHLSAAGNMNSYSPSSIDCKSAAAAWRGKRA